MTPALNVVHMNAVRMIATSPIGGGVNEGYAEDGAEGFTKEEGDYDLWD